MFSLFLKHFQKIYWLSILKNFYMKVLDFYLLKYLQVFIFFNIFILYSDFFISYTFLKRFFFFLLLKIF